MDLVTAPRRLRTALTLTLRDEAKPKKAERLDVVTSKQLDALMSATKRDQPADKSADEAKLGIKAARALARARFGDDPLPINPATGKKITATGRNPTTGTRSPVLSVDADPPVVTLERRFRTRRERAAELEERMHQFSGIYNAGWIVRNAYFGPEQRLHESVMQFIAVMLTELRETRDYEALVFAIADTLTASPHGVPWEP